MRLESKKYLYDVQNAAALVANFTSGKTFEDYSGDALLRSAVERQFEIVGEALGQFAKLEPSSAGRIRNHRQIVAFRNILIHGYAQIDDRLVWDIIQSRLAGLRADVDSLLAD